MLSEAPLRGPTPGPAAFSLRLPLLWDRPRPCPHSRLRAPDACHHPLRGRLGSECPSSVEPKGAVSPLTSQVPSLSVRSLVTKPSLKQRPTVFPRPWAISTLTYLRRSKNSSCRVTAGCLEPGAWHSGKTPHVCRVQSCGHPVLPQHRAGWQGVPEGLLLNWPTVPREHPCRRHPSLGKHLSLGRIFLLILTRGHCSVNFR